MERHTFLFEMASLEGARAEIPRVKGDGFVYIEFWSSYTVTLVVTSQIHCDVILIHTAMDLGCTYRLYLIIYTTSCSARAISWPSR